MLGRDSRGASSSTLRCCRQRCGPDQEMRVATRGARLGPGGGDTAEKTRCGGCCGVEGSQHLQRRRAHRTRPLPSGSQRKRDSRDRVRGGAIAFRPRSNRQERRCTAPHRVGAIAGAPTRFDNYGYNTTSTHPSPVYFQLNLQLQQMSIIKDGAVSGFLPGVEAFAVHYPGYPSSMPRAIETLGGTEGILKAHSNHSNKLELRFRPEDPYSHPAFGELQPCKNLILKIFRKKSVNMCSTHTEASNPEVEIDFPVNSMERSKQQTGKHENEPISICREVEALDPEKVHGELSAVVVARVFEAYHFSGMVDYQYVLPAHSDATRSKKRSWMEMEPPIRKCDMLNLYHEGLLMLSPPLFSVKDVPKKVVLRPSNLKKQVVVAEDCWEMDIEPCFDIDFMIEKIPRKINWEDHIPQDSYHWELQMALSKIFDDRPIWAKSAVRECLLDQGINIGDYMLRRLLFRTTYSFLYGPFKTFYIRKGYDPRKDVESRIYQVIDFRVPRSLRSYCEVNAAKGLMQRRKDLSEFRVFPLKCQTSLQLFELVDDYIQQEIRKPIKQMTCTRATGWFSKAMLNLLLLRVKVRFLSIYPGSGAEALLKSAVANFEKSKRMLFYKIDLGQEAHEKQHSNQGDKEETNDVDNVTEDDVVADDGGEDNDEEDLSEAPVFGEDDELYLQSQSNVGSISRNYLQELFGTVLSNDAIDNGLQDGDASDEEYEIYGHYDDDNYTDGED